MLRQLGELATVTVVPAATPADAVLDLDPDGIFLSNGPGDPAALPGVIDEIRPPGRRRDGARLRHLPRPPAAGHRPRGHAPTSSPSATTAGTTRCGGPTTGRVEITSQNHNYAVAADSLGATEVTHVNLNDGVIEGLAQHRGPGLQRAVPPRGRPRAPRRPLPVRGVPAADGRPRRAERHTRPGRSE